MAHGIEDVARAAGVSTATVSRALRALPGVSDATRQRVLTAADELGYVASPSAASLASGRTRTVGIITPWVNHWYYAEVIEGAERALRGSGFDALLHTFDADRERPRHVLDAGALRRRVDGILVIGVPLTEVEVASVDGVGVPVVFVGSGARGHVLVRIDDEGTARAATEHLLGLGHRAIGHVTGPRDDVEVAGSEVRAAPFWRRVRGWRATLVDAGCPVEAALVEYGSDGVGGGRASTHALLDRRPDVTALVAASDEIAMGAVLAARDRGLRVPEDLSVIGIDGHSLGELVGLTTMSQPAVDQGAAAAGVLLDLVVGARTTQDVVFPVELVVRATTAARSAAGLSG